MAADAITLLTEDHRRVDELFDEYRQASDPDTKERLVRTLVSELSIHAAIEEQFLYPVVREVLPDGDELADESLDEHQQVKDVLAALERLGVESPEFEAKMDELIDDVRHHVSEEEQELFPKLRQAVGESRLVQMGRALAVGKAMAPTHPHPELPNRPPANLVVGPVAGVADRVRDGLEAFADEGQWAELVRQGQQAVWDVVRTWADAAQRNMPNVSATVAGRWRPDEAVEGIFEFSNRLLSMQRQFASDLFGAVGRITDEVWEQPPSDEEEAAEAPSAEEAAAASAPRARAGAGKPTAERAAPKKTAAKRTAAKKTAAKRSAAKRTARKSAAQPAAAAAEQAVPERSGAQEQAPEAAAETAPAAGEGGARTPTDYTALSVVELRELAKRRDIKGRTGMNKAQLVRALQELDQQQDQ